MGIANGNQIIAGQAAYETLRSRDEYVDAFRMVKAEVKHGRIITAYQFKGFTASFLNVETPCAVLRSNAIDIEMIEEMERQGGYTTPGMARVTFAAAERWEAEMEESLAHLSVRCTDEQRTRLEATQEAWKMFYEREKEFIGALRKTVNGSMYRLLTASIYQEHPRARAISLRNYLEEWLHERSEDSPSNNS